MSRIGKKPIKLVSGVKAQFKKPLLEMTGKLGKLTREIPHTIDIEIKGDEVFVKNISDNPGHRSVHGLTRTLVNNMVLGLSQGYSKELELQGVGYRAAVSGKVINLQLGFSHPVEFPVPEGITVKVDGNTKIMLSGSDKELLGVTAAKLRRIRPPEPYKGKGIRYQGEVIVLKEGKAAGAGAGGGK